MKINILSPGRFHVCDLARELAAHGHDVRFYSFVPKSRTHKFGLPDACARPVLIWVVLPLILSRVLGKMGLSNWANHAVNWWLDLVVSCLMEPCDVVIAMSGIFHRSITRAKSKWGSKILIERGSRHILSQKKILDELRLLNSKAKTVSESDVWHELRDYEIADRIVVPSRHVVESFVEFGVAEKRLFGNPYGVDLSMFSPTFTPSGKPTVLMTGSWCYRKGCDFLAEAMKETGYRLLHAGPQGDCPFPTEGWFETVGVLDQSILKNTYARAHVFVLPSREDGWGLVLAQALACGLSIVCSDKTGGRDLLEMMDDKNKVIIINSGDVDALREGIVKAMSFALDCQGLRQISESAREQMSWKAYGERYHHFLTNLVNGSKHE
jgi:starch synthase